MDRAATRLPRDVDDEGMDQEEEGGAAEMLRRDDSTVVSVKQEVWRRAVSVHMVIAMVCLLGVVLSVTSSEMLETTACDMAIDDTRRTMDNATNALGKSATDSLDKVSGDLLGASQVGMAGMLQMFLSEGLKEANGLRHTVTTFLQDVPKNESEWLWHGAPALWHQSVTLLEDSPVLALGTYTDTMGLLYFMSGGKLALYLLDDARPNNSFFGYALPDGTGREQARIPTTTTAGRLRTTSLANTTYLPFQQLKFSGLVPVGTGVGMVLVEKFRDRAGVHRYIAASMYMRLSKIQTYVTDMAQTGEGSVPRVFLVVASCWLADAKRALGLELQEYDEQTGYATAVSHGECTEEFIGVNTMTGRTGPQNRIVPAVNVSDPYIRGIAVSLDGDYASCVGRHRRVTLTINGTDEDHFVGAQRITFADAGLDWWVVMSVDALSIFGEVDASREAVTMQIEEEKGRVAEDVRTNRNIARGIVVVVGFAIILGSFYVSYIVVRPIKALQEKMMRVANMELAGLDLQATSLFYEVYRMQTDFRRMVENLVEFRAYVPLAVLEGSGAGDSMKQRTVPPPTGNVTILFTDIKGSTELWRRSPADMNTAMETHNEEIRAACADHGGYEVKTIGDSFMISFSCPVAAAQCALDIQSRLRKRRWPSPLMLPEAGLVVRIGINTGPTIAEKNPVTGRVDYRGSTVNLASRVEGKALSGTVCVTSDTFAQIKGDLQQLGSPAVSNWGGRRSVGWMVGTCST